MIGRGTKFLTKIRDDVAIVYPSGDGVVSFCRMRIILHISMVKLIR